MFIHLKRSLFDWNILDASKVLKELKWNFFILIYWSILKLVNSTPAFTKAGAFEPCRVWRLSSDANSFEERHQVGATKSCSKMAQPDQELARRSFTGSLNINLKPKLLVKPGLRKCSVVGQYFHLALLIIVTII